MRQEISFRQRLAQNTAASVATNIWTIVLALGTLPLVLRGLGRESFGIWVLLQTFSATTGWLSIPANGLVVSARREVATASTRTEHELGRAVGAAVATFGASGVAFGIAIAAAGPSILNGLLDLDGYDYEALHLVTLAFGVQIIAEHLCLALTSVLEGVQEVAVARGIDAARKTAVALAVAGVATADGGLGAVGVASAAAALGTTVAAALLVRRTRRLRLFVPEAAGVRAMVQYAGTVSFLQSTGVLYRTMDRTIAGVLFGPGAVAVVEVANQVQLGSTALLSATTYPMFSSAPWLRARGDDAALTSLLNRLTRYSVLLTVPLVTLIVVFAGPFVRLWLGANFDEAIGLVQVSVVTVAWAAPLTAGSNLLQGTGHAGAVLRATAAAAIVNLGASIFLAQAVGIVGVFLGTIVASVVLTPLLVRSIDRHAGGSSLARGLDALRRALPPAVAIAAVGGAAVWLEPSDLIAVVVGGAAALAVAGVVAARWSLDPGERAELANALRRGKAA